MNSEFGLQSHFQVHRVIPLEGSQHSLRICSVPDILLMHVLFHLIFNAILQKRHYNSYCKDGKLRYQKLTSLRLHSLLVVELRFGHRCA